MNAMTRECEVAIEAARVAGRVLIELGGEDLDIQAKGDTYNLVTEADLRAERVILDLLCERFPDHAILSEEEGGSKEIAGPVWAVDPLDGTNNFAHGFPFYAVSIALWIDGEPRIGVVHDPTRGEMFHAERGRGARLNGRPIHVSRATALDQSIFATGFYYDRGEMMRRTLRQIEAFFVKPVRGIRRTGSAALDLCYVAAGRLDGFWELHLGPWDYAAGVLLVTEAGGRVTDVTGGPCRLHMNSVLASNGRLHDAMREVICTT